MKRVNIFLVDVIIMFLFVIFLNAQIPKKISYQGLLIFNNGLPVQNGIYSLTFELYEEQTGGIPLWSETQNDIIVTNGTFSVFLGTFTPLNISFNKTYYVQVILNSGNEVKDPIVFTPRSILTSSPYSFQADTANFAKNSLLVGDAGGDLTGQYPNPSIANNSINSNKILNGTIKREDVDISFKSPYADTADVAVSINEPLIMMGNSEDPIISGVNSGTGIGIYGYGKTGISAFSTNGVAIYAGFNDSISNFSYVSLASANNILYGVNQGRSEVILGSLDCAIYGGLNPTREKIEGRIGSMIAGVEGSHYSGGRGYLGYGVDGVHGYGLSGGENIGSGVVGYASSSIWSPLIGYGVVGINSSGNKGLLGGRHYGVYGLSDSNFAGYFEGNVHVTGSLTTGNIALQLDHPLDPENKFIYHSFIASPDMKNIYDGIVQLDEKGEAWVELPSYFEAMNKDFRYQLCAIGASAPNLFVSQKILNNRFKIAGGVPNIEVSWQVTGTRKDEYAKTHPVIPEIEKSNNQKGKYIYPKEYGVSETLGLEYLHIQQLNEKEKELKKQYELLKSRQ